jgi:hypothetical protein
MLLKNWLHKMFSSWCTVLLDHNIYRLGGGSFTFARKQNPRELIFKNNKNITIEIHG